MGDADRVILEQHVAECELCLESLRQQQRVNAVLYEAFAPDRLRVTLRNRILEHLPEIDPVYADIEVINERAKHPVSLWTRFGQLVPVAAVAVLLFVTLVLKLSLPDAPASEVWEPTVGVVTYSSGGVTRIEKDRTERTGVEVSSLVTRGDRFETAAGSGMMLSVAGPTRIKLGENTRVQVNDPRNLTLERGQVWLDVGRDGRLFKVRTPRGLVTVFGTVFSVVVQNDETTVTVERGGVQVANDTQFCSVEAGQQVVARNSGVLTTPEPVDTRPVHAWARRISPDSQAEEVFKTRIQALAPAGELPSIPVYRIDVTRDDSSVWTVNAIRIYWQPDRYLSGHCSYDVYVSDSMGKPLFKGRLDAAQFADKRLSSFDILPDKTIQGVPVINVQLVPDYSTGRIEADGIDVKAQAASS